MARGRRASLPGASELFRPTQASEEVAPQPTEAAGAPEAPTSVPQPAEVPAASGRVRHDHKITVYFSADELNALEDANLLLRRTHGIRVDRGRLVRTAVALALRDLLDNGGEADVVQELKE